MSITTSVNPQSRRSTVVSASALFLGLTALILLGATGQQTGRAAGADDCVLGRDSGTAAPACYALNPDSPYLTAGIGGTRIGADAQALDRIAACVAAGDTRSPACTMAPIPAPVMNSPKPPNAFRIVR
jgi:hypothetical protein